MAGQLLSDYKVRACIVVWFRIIDPDALQTVVY